MNRCEQNIVPKCSPISSRIHRRAPHTHGLHVDRSPTNPGAHGTRSHRRGWKVPGTHAKFQDFRRRALKTQHILVQNVQVSSHQAHVPVKLVGHINRLLPRQRMNPHVRTPKVEQSPERQFTPKTEGGVEEGHIYQMADRNPMNDTSYCGKNNQSRSRSCPKAKFPTGKGPPGPTASAEQDSSNRAAHDWLDRPWHRRKAIPMTLP